jgi:protein gp37
MVKWGHEAKIAFEFPILPLLGPIDLSGVLGPKLVNWVIVGGESGRGARPMSLDWVRSIHEQCKKAHIPFFFKQWGGANKKANGRLLDDRTWDELPGDKAPLVAES